MKNYSKQREEILEVLNFPDNHLTADEVYNKVKNIDTTISKATVYRNLNNLVEDGILWKISMKDGIMRYDYPKQKHNHIICSKCGVVKDFLYNFGTRNIKKEVLLQTNMETNLETIVVYGICEECSNS